MRMPIFDLFYFSKIIIYFYLIQMDTPKKRQWLILDIGEDYHKAKDKAYHIIVPSTWIFFDESKIKLATKYSCPPYDEATEQQLVETLVETRGPPPQDWENYAVVIQGDASKIFFISHINNQNSLFIIMYV